MKPIYLTLTVCLLILCSCKKNQEPETKSEEPNFSNIQATASIGDTLVFNGENFPGNQGSLSVSFGTEKATILSQDPKSLKLIVPPLKSTSCDLVIRDKQNNILAQQVFNLDPVKIISTLSNVKSGEKLTIYGKNFQVLSNLTVNVNDKKITEIDVNATGLSFTMPESLYPGRQPTISVMSSNTSLNLTTSTTVADKWVRVAYSPFVFRQLFASFVFKDEGYVLSYDKEGVDKKALFYKLNPNTYQYTTYQVPINTTDAVATSSDVFVVRDKTGIFKYDLDTTFSFVAQIPNPDEKRNLFLAIGDDIFAFSGMSDYWTPSPKMDFYKFNTSTETWSAMADFPERILGIQPRITVEGKKAFVVVDYTRFYIYNAETNQWTKKSFPINPSRHYITAYYSQHGKVYALVSPGMSNETIYEYDIAADTWKNLGILRAEPSGNLYGFFIGNKHFIGGHKYDPFSTELFESDASYLFK